MDYKVDERKLKEVFKLAGKLVNVDLATDKDGNSRGFAVIEYEHAVEAVQSISMFDRQMLFERRMTVRLDRVPDKNEQIKLPEGLVSIGIGLGANGEPLRNVALNMISMQQQQSNQNSMCNNNNMNINPAPVPVAPPINGGGGGSGVGGAGSILGPVPNASLGNNLAALNSVVGSLGNLGALSNPLLSSAAASLNSLGLNLGGNAGGNQGGGNDASMPSFNSMNQQQTGNYGNSGGYGNANFSSSRNSDFDLGGSNSVRSYNTQPQDNYNNQQSQGGQQNQQMGGDNAVRGSDTIIIRNVGGVIVF